VFVVLAGSGTLRVRDAAGADMRALRFSANSTLVVQPNFVHQARPLLSLRALRACADAGSAQVMNTGDELLQLTVIISRPPIQVFVYDSWETPDALATPRVPYLFDRECATSNAASGHDRLSSSEL
jgi:hypothetical protein